MHITVVGTHKLSTRPERATLSLSAGFESESKEEVVRMTSALVNQLHADFKALKANPAAPITWFAVLPLRTHSASKGQKGVSRSSQGGHDVHAGPRDPRTSVILGRVRRGDCASFGLASRGTDVSSTRHVRVLGEERR